GGLGKAFGYGPERREVGRLMERRERDEGLEAGQDGGVDEHGLGVPGAAVDDAVPDGDGLRAAQMVTQPLRDDGGGPAVIARLRGAEVPPLLLSVAERAGGEAGMHADAVEQPARGLLEIASIRDAPVSDALAAELEPRP